MKSAQQNSISERNPDATIQLEEAESRWEKYKILLGTLGTVGDIQQHRFPSLRRKDIHNTQTNSLNTGGHSSTAHEDSSGFGTPNPEINKKK